MVIKRGLLRKGLEKSKGRSKLHKLASWASLTTLEVRLARETSDKPQMSTPENYTDLVIQKPAGI